jgi:hypothetical protein
MGFLQSGAGAVLRAVQSVLAERLSVTDFGAVATPGVDNTAAIQAAINEALASGRALHIPGAASPFDHASPLSVPYDATNTRRLRIVGQHGLAYFATGRTSALRYTGTAGHAITIQGRAGGAGGNNQGHPVSFELDRVAWIGNASCLGAVRVARGWYASITKNSFFGFSNAAGSVIEFDSDDVDAGGVSFSGTSKIENNNFATSGRCIVLTGASGGIVNALTIRGNVMLDQQYGVISQFSPGVPYAEHIIIEGNHFEGTVVSDVFAQGAAANWVIERNYIEQNNPAANSPRIDIQGAANFAITIERNTFSKQLQAAGQALVRVTNGKNISVTKNVSNFGGNTDRWSVDLINCAESEAEPMESPATAIAYPVLMNNFPIRAGRVNDTWRAAPATGAGQFVGLSAGDGWPGGTVSTVVAESNRTNGLFTLSFRIAVTTKSAAVGNALFGVLPKPNNGAEICVPVFAQNVVGAKPIFLRIGAGQTTGVFLDANGAALSYQAAISVGSVIQGQVKYLTQE